DSTLFGLLAEAAATLLEQTRVRLWRWSCVEDSRPLHGDFRRPLLVPLCVVLDRLRGPLVVHFMAQLLKRFDEAVLLQDFPYPVRYVDTLLIRRNVEFLVQRRIEVDRDLDVTVIHYKRRQRRCADHVNHTSHPGDDETVVLL